MTGEASSLAQAAQRFIGVPFRLHGRDPAAGLDCVGLVASALTAMGRVPIIPRAYSLRNSDIAELLTFASANAFEDHAGPIEPDNLILVRPGPAQFHLLIAEHSGSFIHAHAGLRRVVRMPGRLAWTIDRQWRLTSKD